MIAARREWPGSEWAVFRTLQLANFNTPLLFDDDEQLREVLGVVEGVDPDRIVSLIDDPEVVAEYEQDKAETRTAAGSPTEFQGKAGNSDGHVRYTAPSVVFTRAADGLRLEAGGMQTVEAYDVLVANLDPTLERKAPPEDPAEALEHFPLGLTTAEVAAILTPNNGLPDLPAAERALLGLVAEGRAERHPLGGDALWTVPGGQRPPRLAHEQAAADGLARRSRTACRTAARRPAGSPGSSQPGRQALLDLRPGQVGADAVMDAGAERQDAQALTGGGDVKGVRVVGAIAVCVPG